MAGDQDWALAVVAGTGQNPPAVIADVFESFINGGAGTAIRPLAVHGIVTDLGGHLDISSVMGHGTTVTIALPLAEALALAEAPALPEVSPPSVFTDGQRCGTVPVLDEVGTQH
jgi:hypothetical protein